MHREDPDSPVLRSSRDAVSFDSRRVRLERYVTSPQEDLAEWNKILRAQRVVDEQDWR